MTKRVAVRFSRGSEAAGLAHREVVALLAGALRRSELPLALTEGSDKRPKFGVAGSLPAGYTSDAEWLELVLTQAAAPADVMQAIEAALPEGFHALEAARLGPRSPSLQSQLRWAEYSIGFGVDCDAARVQGAVESFFERGTYPWEEVIEGKAKRFDLCALTDDLWVRDVAEGPLLAMRLDASSNGSGRPDSVLKGLGLPEPVSRHRTRLIFSYLPQGLLLWRRAGRFENGRPER